MHLRPAYYLLALLLMGVVPSACGRAPRCPPGSKQVGRQCRPVLQDVGAGSNASDGEGNEQRDASTEDDTATGADASVCEAGRCDPAVVTISVIFPWPGITDADTIRVRARATSPLGDRATVTVQGKLVTGSNGNGDLISEPVPLRVGVNTIRVIAATASGLKAETSVEVIREELWGRLVGMSGMLDVSDGTNIWSVDSSSGTKALVSGPTRGKGPLGYMGDLAGSWRSNNLLVVGGEMLLSVDRASGDRTVVSQDGVRGAGPPLPLGSESLVQGASGFLYILYTNNKNDHGIMRVDPASGDRTIVRTPETTPSIDTLTASTIASSSELDQLFALEVNGVGSKYHQLSGKTGALLSTVNYGEQKYWEAAAIDSRDGLHYIVTDDVAPAVLKLDPGAGPQSELSVVSGWSGSPSPDSIVGSGPPLILPQKIVDGGNGMYVLDRNASALVRVDTTTGDRSYLARTSRGSGRPFDPQIVEYKDDRLWINDGNRGRRIFQVEAGTGNRTEVDLPFSNFCIGGDGNTLYGLGDSNSETAAAVYVAGDGTARTISGPSQGSGPPLSNLRACVFAEQTKQLIVLDSGRIIGIQVDTGDRTELSGGGWGTGPSLPALPFSADLAYDEGRNRLFVVSTSPSEVYAVDLVSGNRAMVTLMGPSPSGVVSAEWDSTRLHLLVVGTLSGKSTLFTVDPVRGKCDPISDTTLGQGPWGYPDPAGLAWIADRRLAVISTMFALVLVDTETRDRIIISR